VHAVTPSEQTDIKLVVGVGGIPPRYTDTADTSLTLMVIGDIVELTYPITPPTSITSGPGAGVVTSTHPLHMNVRRMPIGCSTVTTVRTPFVNVMQSMYSCTSCAASSTMPPTTSPANACVTTSRAPLFGHPYHAVVVDGSGATYTCAPCALSNGIGSPYT
jgi:hypothetical protein